MTALRDANYERSLGCFDDILADGAEAIDLWHAVDLYEQAVQKAKVALVICAIAATACASVKSASLNSRPRSRQRCVSRNMRS